MYFIFRFLEDKWAIPLYYDRFSGFRAKFHEIMAGKDDSELAMILQKINTISGEDVEKNADILFLALEQVNSKNEFDELVHSYFMETKYCATWP